MKKLTELEVGDKVIYATRYNRSTLTVQRLTKTQAILPKDIRISLKTGRLIGISTWDVKRVEIATDELIKEVEEENYKNKLIYGLAHFDEYKSLSVEELECACKCFGIME